MARTLLVRAAMKLGLGPVSLLLVGAASLASFACVAAGCSSSSAATVADDAGVDAAPPGDDADAGPDAAPCVPATLSVSRSSKVIDPPRDHHVTTVIETSAGPFLYVFGGEQNDFQTVHSDVQRAPIAADGSLGDFATVSTIPNGLAGSAFARVGDTLVFAGGTPMSPSVIAADTHVVHVAADGTLGEWTKGPALPSKVMHSAAITYKSWVYVFGGTTGRDALPISVRATVGDDGTVSDWEPMRSLPHGRSHQAAFLHGTTIYLLGGLAAGAVGNPPDLDDVIRADIQEDGTLSKWTSAGKLPMPLSVSAAQEYGCAFYMFGGLTDDGAGTVSFPDTIVRGVVEADGTVGELGLDPAKLSIGRGHVHQTPLYKSFIYSVGGRAEDDSAAAGYDETGVIDVGTFTGP